jgi:hypothetical protein
MEYDDRHDDRGSGICALEESQRRIELTGLDTRQSRDDYSGTPDVGAKVKRVSLQRLAVVLFRRLAQHPRPRPIHDDRSRHYRERPDIDLDVDFTVHQAIGGAVDNPGARGQQQHRLEHRREVLDLSMSVGVSADGGLARKPHRHPGHERRDKIQGRVSRFRQNAQAARQNSDHDFQACQSNRGGDGVGRGLPLLSIC